MIKLLHAIRVFIPVFLLLLSCNYSFAQTGDTDSIAAIKKAAAAYKPEKKFPFVIDDSDKEYDLSIDLHDQLVKSKYEVTFKKYNLPYNAETMQEIFIQLLQKYLPYMANTVTFLDNEPMLYIQSGNKTYQQSILDTLRPILYDNAQLSDFLKNLDRTNID
ncbi:hypothetical protein ACTHGU_21545 [Chitinophagaceae bacterium MMS25-I14]